MTTIDFVNLFVNWFFIALATIALIALIHMKGEEMNLLGSRSMRAMGKYERQAKELRRKALLEMGSNRSIAAAQELDVLEEELGPRKEGPVAELLNEKTP